MAGIISEQTQAGISISVAGEANILRAVEFKQELAKVFAASQNLALDLSAVTSIDLAFVQLILAYQQAAAARGLGFSIGPNVPPAFEQLTNSAALDKQTWSSEATGAQA